MLNPRSYITPELWTQAPILKGTTKFEPLADARNIMVAGGARFTCVLHSRPCQPQLLNGHSELKIGVIQLAGPKTWLMAVSQCLLVCPSSDVDVPN